MMKQRLFILISILSLGLVALPKLALADAAAADLTSTLQLSEKLAAEAEKTAEAATRIRKAIRRTLAAIEHETRLQHTKELLGSRYRKAVSSFDEKAETVDHFVKEQTGRALKGEWKSEAPQVAQAILDESSKYRFDPVFIMAVIENESSFVPTAKGSSGEIGLMQLTPATAKWIAKKYDLPWKGKKTLKDPVANIRLGAAYLSYLREHFDFHSRLYIAAYNMGSTNVQRALDKQITPKDYPSRVMHRYLRMYSELKEDLRQTFTKAN